MLIARRTPHACAALLFLACVGLPAVGQSAAVSQGGSKQAQGDLEPYFDPPPAPVLDPFSALTADASVEIGGLAPESLEVEIDAPSGRFRVPTTGDAFTATVPLVSNVANAIYVTGIGLGGSSAPTTISITQDGSPPNLFIDFPANGSQVTVESIDVAGRVGDLLSGFAGLVVDVNGVRAAVDVGLGTNGTFLATDVPLVVSSPPTPTTITATAVDALGNQATTQIVVTHAPPPPGVPQLAALSGDGQAGAVGTVLGQPLVTRVTQPDGTTPIAGKLVTFTVAASDGRLSSDGSGPGALTYTAFTDANGEARAFWRLGSDAGCGNNRVRVESTGTVGTALFCASATPGPVASIQVGTGSGQVAEAGAPLVQPLTAWVTDGCNGLAGVPVTFTVTEGGGLVDGQSQVVVVTGLTGHAAVELELGPEPGNQRIEADYAGNTGPPAVFIARAVKRDPMIETSFAGVVLDNAGRGIGGAACSLDVGGQTLTGVVTDASGQFVFSDLAAAGPAHLHIDAGVATSVGGDPIPMGSFPGLGFLHVVVPNAVNALSTPIRIPRLDPQNDVFFDNTQDVELEVAGMPGLKMTVRAGSMTLANGMVPDAQNPAVLALNQVHFDEIPMPMPNGVTTPFAWTLQPGGAHFDPPVEIQMPNVSGLPAGAVAYFLSFDHDVEQFAIVAQGRVSDDGSVVRTDPGAGLAVAGWGGTCPPYGPFTSAFGDMVTSWAPSMPFTLNVTALFSLADQPCSQFQDGTPEGELARRQCVQNGINCIQEFFLGALGLVDTTPAPAPPGLPGVARDAFEELQETLNSAFGGNQVLTPSVALSSTDAYEIQSQMPGLIAEWTGDATFGGAPDHLDFGDVIQLTGLEGFGFGPDAQVLFEVTAKNSPTSFSFAARLYDPDQRPTCFLAVGNQTFPLDEFGPFTTPQIPANGLVRALVFCEGVGVQYVVGSQTFVTPNAGGPTDLGPVVLTEFAHPRESSSVSPSSLALTSPGATVQLTVTALLDDGTTLDVTSPAEGSTYVSSAPAVATVSANGLVTAQGEGIAFVTTTSDGITATVPVAVSFGDPLTTVVGIVTTASGIPVPGATVTVVPSSLAATTAANGSFQIPNVPTELGPLTLFADANLGSSVDFQSTSVVDFVAVPGGFTDVGLIPLEPTVFWALDGNGQWNVPGNWSTGQVPGPGDRVVIDRPAGDYTITISNIVADVASLRCRESLTIGLNGELSTSEPLSVDGMLTLTSGGRLTGARLFPGTGGQGLTTAQSGGTVDGVVLQAELASFGQTRVENGLELRAGGNFSAMSASGNLIFVGSQTLAGQGTVGLAGTRIDSLNGTLTVESGIEIRGAGIVGTTGQTVRMRGTVRVPSGTLTMRGTLVNENGSYRADPGAAIEFLDSIDNTGSVFHASGLHQMNGLTFTGGTYEGDATSLVQLTGSNTTVLLDGVSSFDTDVLVTQLKTLRVDGDLVLGSGRTVTLQNAPLTFASTGALTGAAEVVLDAGTLRLANAADTLTIEPSVTVRGHGTLDGRGDNLIVQRGTVIAEGGSLRFDGSYRNEAGTYLADPGAELLLAPLTFSVTTIDNTGSVFTTDGPVRATNLTFTGGAWDGGPSSFLTLAGSNTVVALEGLSSFDTDVLVPQLTVLSVDGDLVLGAGRTATVQNATLRFDSTGTLAGAAELALDGGTLRLSNASDVLTIDSGITVRGNGALDGRADNLIVQRGTLTAEGGSLRLDGSYRNESGTYLADPGAELLLAPFTFSVTTIDNTGSVFTTDGAVRATNLTVTGGDWNGGPSSLLTLTGSNTIARLDGLSSFDSDAFAPSLTTLSIDGDLILGAGRTVTIQSTPLRFESSGTLGGAGEVVLDGGRITLQEASDTVTIGPAATVRGHGRLGLSGASSFVNLGAIVADVPDTAGEELRIEGQLENAGSVTILPGCALRAVATFQQTAGLSSVGGTLIASVDLLAGSLDGSGALVGDLSNTGGSVRPGGTQAAGSLSVSGTYDQSRGGTLEVELAGTLPGSDVDVLSVGGAATLGGTLSVSLLAGFQPSVGDSFGPLTWSSATGTFDATAGLDVRGGVVLQESYGPNGLTLDAVPAP